MGLLSLEPVVRSSIVQMHDDESGLIVDAGAPVTMAGSGVSVDREPPRLSPLSA
jgi:hypothetical protein